MNEIYGHISGQTLVGLEALIERVRPYQLATAMAFVSEIGVKSLLEMGARHGVEHHKFIAD